MSENNNDASKNIVLLSDGTGNSSAKLFKTNVWRLFQALDLKDPKKQVAYYDNGVGTSSFKLFAILGGVFGFGLKRNVIDIYSFCCRNYKPGDRIYGFGFSRGAFTMRVVAGLIAREGLVPYNGDETALARYAESAYRDYRRRFNATEGLVNPLRNMRDAIVRAYRNFMHIPQYDKNAQIQVESIHFLGLWDTVDAYGGPIEEITRAIDDWIWPLSMPDRFLHGKVHRACHALALEDERDAFRPVIWDERYTRRADGKLHAIDYGWEPNVEDETKLKPIDRQRLSQVWFVGVHSDVGGGYPEDGLSYVTLDWMIDRAEPYGLLLNALQHDLIKPLVNAYDKLNDSRQGLAGYYRLRPRNLRDIYRAPSYKRSSSRDREYVNAELEGKAYFEKDVQRELADGGLLVRQPVPTIHQAAFDRIKIGTDGYAPFVIPAKYRVTDKAGQISPPAETAAEATARATRQEDVWDWVWKRRVVYFLTVGASVLLAALPLFQKRWPGLGKDSPFEVLIPVIDLVGRVLPSFASYWIDAFKDAPERLVVCTLLLASLLYTGGVLKETLRDRMRAIWAAPQDHADAPSGPIYWLRTRGWYRKSFYILKNWLLPGLFAFLMAIVLLMLASRILFGVANVLGVVCSGTSSSDIIDVRGAGSEAKPFATKDACKATGLRVTDGQTYQVTLEVAEAWVDGGIATGPNGFGWDRTASRQVLALPLRRLVATNWFATVLRVGRFGVEEHVLDFKPAVPLATQGWTFTATFKARSNGEVFLFVNDAVMAIPFAYDFFYTHNNKGTAKVSLKRIDSVAR